MRRMNWLFLVLLAVFVLSAGFMPVVSSAQQEEEEEVIQTRPNPMDRTMRKPASRSNTMMLNDGRQLQQKMQGGKQVWFVVGKNGQQTVANGSYALQNGLRMNVRRGIVNERMNPQKMQQVK